ncbi:hypothetical protein [Ruminococcus flavefaciens]|uniref:hypothetical protein n=1 Tax=Ruminococcus flavefaciens TaxID=1265 RepID=UPI0026EF4E4F|nr:hypothetical protein [Ruminococcus flavefaciens]
MPDTPTIVQRHKIVAFYGVTTTTTSGGTTTSTTTFHRMKKFTQLAKSQNPIEYGRQYVDEPFAVTDVMGYNPSIAYVFDKHRNLPVQEDIIKITNEELLGDDAVRPIIIVDTETNEAWKRDFAVIPNSEGDNINVYTYSGNFKCKGELIKGTAATSDDYQTVTFTEVSD